MHADINNYMYGLFSLHLSINLFSVCSENIVS